MEISKEKKRKLQALPIEIMNLSGLTLHNFFFIFTFSIINASVLLYLITNFVIFKIKCIMYEKEVYTIFL